MDDTAVDNYNDESLIMIIDDTAVDNYNDDEAAADNDKAVSGNVRNYVLLTYMIAFVPLKSC